MTIQEIAQWVIDNRYPKSEHEKVSDMEMYYKLSADLEIYAEAKAKEAYNQGVRDAAESAEIELPNGLLCKIISTIDVNGEEFEFHICINKQSILKLLK